MIDRRDVYLTSHRTAQGWGGAWTRGNAIHATCQARGLSTLLLGTVPGRTAPEPLPDTPAMDVPLGGASPWWRLRNWLLVRPLERFLRRLPPPRIAFVGMTMHWVIAAKRAWPDVRVVYNLPCFLTLCLPFTWRTRRPPTLWHRLDYAGICRAERRALALADVILGGTPQVRLEAGLLAPACVDRVDVRPYGPPPATVAPELRAAQRRTLGLDDDHRLFLAAGLCDRNKAFDLAVAALPATDCRVHLAIVGEGPQRAALLRLVEHAGLRDRVHIPGPQQDMTPWYAATDVVLSTSHYDMYPNTVQEGWAHGRPVLVPQNDPPRVYAGAAPVVEEAGGGLLYDQHAPGALAAAMNRLARDAELHETLASQARALAAQRAGWARCVDAIGGVPSPAADASAQCDVQERAPAEAGVSCR